MTNKNDVIVLNEYDLELDIKLDQIIEAINNLDKKLNIIINNKDNIINNLNKELNIYKKKIKQLEKYNLILSLPSFRSLKLIKKNNKLIYIVYPYMALL